MKKSYFIFLLFCLFFANCYSQTANIDFEATAVGAYTTPNAVSGWTVSSQTHTSSCTSNSLWSPGSPEFSIVSTPLSNFQIVGPIQHSPLGGLQIARINNSIANSNSTRIANSFTVTSSHATLRYAYAMISDGGNHWCCDQPFFSINLKNQGQNLACVSYSTSIPGFGCANGATGFSITSNGNGSSIWNNWIVKEIDLSAYTGSVITMEVSASDCVIGDHYATLFFDARLEFTPPVVSYCSGSGNVLLTVPPGNVAFQWTGPGVLPPPTFPNTPIPSSIVVPFLLGAQYTLVTLSVAGCYSTTVYTVAPTQISIGSIATYSTCPSGTSGSATVIPYGSSVGYNYLWFNSSNALVGTNASIANLSAGQYTAIVSSSFACGTQTGVVTIGTATPSPMFVVKKYCSPAVTLTTSGASNFQWYNGSTLIPVGAGGTASTYTVIAPVNQSSYFVSYTSPQGCHDSLEFFLSSVSPGSLSVSYSRICTGATNGIATINLSPSPGIYPITNSYSVFSTGVTTSYSASLAPTASNVFSANGLVAGGTYSVNAFDGLCAYSRSFTVIPFVFNYTVSPASATLCPGQVLYSYLTFTSPPSAAQYSYSWSPTIFHMTAFSPNAIINPMLPPGTSTVINYSVTVTSSLAGCSITKTLTMTAGYPLTPTLNLIPSLCNNANQYTITGNPPNGSFMNGSSNAIGALTGILTPSLANIGVNTFTYVNSMYTCTAKTSGSFAINAAPSLSVSGNTAICKGNSTTLLASGANTFTWNNSSVSPFITVSPLTTSSLSVTGTDLSTNCSNSKNITVTVVPHPSITITGDTLICTGASATLTANGAASYNWNNGSSNPAIIVSPNATSAYSVTGSTSLASCTGTNYFIVEVTNCVQTGLEETFSHEVLIYPNPTLDKLFIDSEEGVSIILYDALGKLILQENIQEEKHVIDMKAFSTGIYTLRVSGINFTKTLKIIKSDD